MYVRRALDPIIELPYVRPQRADAIGGILRYLSGEAAEEERPSSLGPTLAVGLGMFAVLALLVGVRARRRNPTWRYARSMNPLWPVLMAVGGAVRFFAGREENRTMVDTNWPEIGGAIALVGAVGFAWSSVSVRGNPRRRRLAPMPPDRKRARRMWRARHRKLAARRRARREARRR